MPMRKGDRCVPKIAVYFSGYGHTAKQAEAVRAGAESVTNSVVSVYRINEFGHLPSGALEELDLADAIIYGSPTYMGGPAWQFKKFADSSAKAFFARKWKDKLAAGFTNSASINGDKYSTIQYFWTLSQQHGQVWIGTALLPANMKANVPADVNWTAGFAGALAVSPSDASPDEAPRSGDLETAKLLGRRVAELATRSREVVHGVKGVAADL
jgi:NAD(P)H dehydrogenase (quinone)